MHSPLFNYEPGSGPAFASGFFGSPCLVQAEPVYVEMPFPARLRVTDESGERAEITCVLARLSARSLALRLATPLPVGKELAIVVRLSTEPPPSSAATIGIHGRVAAAEPQPDGMYLLHISLVRCWFLYAV